MTFRERWEDFEDTDWYFEHVYRPYSRARYFLRYTLWGRKPVVRPLPPGVVRELESLIEALERGGYNAAPGKLEQGSPLVVEDLSPVMRVVTFDHPGAARERQRQMEHIRNIARFFRLRGWAHTLDLAAASFQKQADESAARWAASKARAMMLLDYGVKMVEAAAPCTMSINHPGCDIQHEPPRPPDAVKCYEFCGHAGCPDHVERP